MNIFYNIAGCWGEGGGGLFPKMKKAEEKLKESVWMNVIP